MKTVNPGLSDIFLQDRHCHKVKPLIWSLLNFQMIMTEISLYYSIVQCNVMHSTFIKTPHNHILQYHMKLIVFVCAGDKYILKMRFVDHVFDDQVIDQMTLRIVLPEGATNIKLVAPFEVLAYFIRRCLNFWNIKFKSTFMKDKSIFFLLYHTQK